MVRIIPDIPKIHARWAHRASEIPDWLEVPMSDGRVIEYYPKVEQPAFRKAMDGISRMVGYQYEKPADAATSNRQQKKELHHILPQKGRAGNG